MKTLKYYKVTDWMLAIGEGFTPCTGILALIHSFNENGTECKASTAYIAKFCGCSRRKVFSDIEYLISKGYITAKKGARTEIVGYTVNVDVCKKAAAAYARDAQELMQEMHKPYAGDAQAYARGAQELMHEVHTKRRKEKENKQERGKNARANARNTSSDKPQKLTAEQEDEIRHGYDLTNCNHHNPEYYLAKQVKYSFDAIIGFILDDGGRKRTEDGTAYSSTSSSIDKSELDELMKRII